MKNSKNIFYVQAALIAALYVVLTGASNLFGLANYAIQVRFSEALTILPFFTPAAIPGLFVGCLLSNFLTGCMLPDIIFGSLATLLGAIGTYFIAKSSKKQNAKFKKAKKWMAPLPPILSNTIIIPLILAYVYNFEGGIPYFMLTVGIGELISCGILGMILFFPLEKIAGKLFR